MPIPDLWPTDIDEGTKVMMPVTILRQQATALAQRTRGLIEAEVRSQPGDDHEFLHEFVLVAPVLDSYTFPLFSLSHPIEGYPVSVSVPTGSGFVKTEASNQERLTDELRTIFGSERTKQIIQALLAQSKS